jgi:hypothetical protein
MGEMKNHRGEERIILKCAFKEEGMEMWTGFKWRRIGSNGGLL